jgi:hypothetical protein
MTAIVIAFPARRQRRRRFGNLQAYHRRVEELLNRLCAINRFRESILLELHAEDARWAKERAAAKTNPRAGRKPSSSLADAER